MAPPQSMVKEQLMHMLHGSSICLVLACLAVMMDLAASAIVTLGVSPFTHDAIALLSHLMLIADGLLFLMYLIRSTYLIAKEMFT